MPGNEMKIRCPMCFMKDIDVVFLNYDEKENEYYCKKCAYSANIEEAKKLLAQFQESRFKERLKPHPFAK